MAEVRDGGQLAFPAAAVRDNGLFSEHFLSERLATSSEFLTIDTADLHQELTALWQRERQALGGRNEAQTEERFIKPILRALGFHYTVQTDLKFGTGRRQPDYALFLSDEHRAAADQADADARFRNAVAVADAKRWDRSLDVKGGKGDEAVDPVAQIINYLLLTRREWGVLTNGRLWRLYAAKGRLTEGACFEVDLVQLLETGTAADLRWFAAFFSAGSLAPGPDGRSFAARALDESRANAVQVGDALQEQVFNAVPLIAEGLLGDDERNGPALAEAFDNSLVLLYRLLFCLYAESRGLLPVGNPHYESYSLRKQKVALAADLGSGRTFSSQSDDLYNDLRGLFRMVDKGDDLLGVTEYNGGLFSVGKHPYFTGRFVSDRLLSQALDLLYRVDGQFVDYRDLSIRHLGTIYERLLDFRLRDGATGLELESATGRHETGSYFTPAHIVDAIVERTLAPLLEQRSRAVLDRGSTGVAALEELLELRVVDPAMGSGHFLVAAAEYMAQHIATEPSVDGYVDLSEARRRVAERCLYGVDLNPMAVELAQLSLWLATVAEEEPLTFLGNLRTGNSLVGVDVLALREAGDSLFQDELAQDVEKILAELGEIASQPSETGADVRAKERHAELVSELRDPMSEHASLTLAPAFGGAVAGFFHWQIEFPEAFFDADGQPLADGGFDAVIGNPPYVRIQELGRQLADYCRKNYDWASGSFDLYLPFLERGVGLLASGGRLGFIVPNKWMKLEYGEHMRADFADREIVEEIIDFRDVQVFDGATNYTCVLVLARAPAETFTYRRLGSGTDVRSAAADLDQLESQEFSAGKWGKRPWVLATGSEGEVLRRIGNGALPLEEVLEQVFTGLQTSADPIYILEDRGRRGNKRVVFSKASDQEFELEPDLLRRLASGPDVERYSFRELKSLLLFPYQRIDDGMRLLDSNALDRLPATAAYLAEHEEVLRAREDGKMDGDGWYAFGRTQSLGAHDSPKLGVAATVSRLEVAADPDGTTYFHNVRVNGILPKEGGPSLWSLLTLLNAKLLDFVFRRGSVDLANGYFAANKQFIAPLPIRVPSSAEARTLDGLGECLFAESRAIEEERAGFLTWLGDLCGAAVGTLAGITALSRYDESSCDEMLEILGTAANRRLIVPDSRARSFREQVAREFNTSVDRLSILKGNVAKLEETADDAVYDLYGLAKADRRLVESEYE